MVKFFFNLDYLQNFRKNVGLNVSYSACIGRMSYFVICLAALVNIFRCLLKVIHVISLLNI